MEEPELIKAKDAVKQTRKSPMDILTEKYTAKYNCKTYKQVAAELEVHVETVRKVCTHPSINAPTYAVRHGNTNIFLFTDEDVQEVREYINSKRQRSR